MKTPDQQLRAMRRALLRIGEFHSTEGAIARLCLMECTGTHPWQGKRTKTDKELKDHVAWEKGLRKAAK